MRDKLRFLSQSVTITGVGSELFKESMEALKDLRQRGERDFKQGQLEEWRPEQFQGDDAVELSNRYFTTRNRAVYQTSVPITHVIDPNGVLRRVAGDNMVHTEDNVVKYYRGYMDGHKKR